MATRDGVGREAPGAAAASCNSNKIVACEHQTHRCCTRFFKNFFLFCLYYLSWAGVLPDVWHCHVFESLKILDRDCFIH